MTTTDTDNKTASAREFEPVFGHEAYAPIHRCDQCKQDMGNQWILGPVCGKCCRANHRRVTGRK